MTIRALPASSLETLEHRRPSSWVPLLRPCLHSLSSLVPQSGLSQNFFGQSISNAFMDGLRSFIPRIYQLTIMCANLLLLGDNYNTMAKLAHAILQREFQYQFVRLLVYHCIHVVLYCHCHCASYLGI
jgi:hypothetical protein